MAKLKTKLIHQIDGQLDPAAKPKTVANPRTLDQILGNTGVGKYQTMQEDEYQNELDNLNKSDLQTHAVSVGLIPVDNRQLLSQRLIREFRKHVASFNAPQSVAAKKVQELPENIRKILAQGR